MMLRIALSFAVVQMLAAQTPSPAADEALSRGVEAFRHQKYAEAQKAFEQAIALQPLSVKPHLYLANTFQAMWIPGAAEPENALLAEKATKEFETVLRIDLKNRVALAGLANLAYKDAMADNWEKARKLKVAEDLYRRLVEVDPSDKTALYSLGVIAWLQFYPAYQQARADLAMRPQTPGPFANLSIRSQLKGEFGSTIEDGVANLQKAIALDPMYDDAMAYLNLLIRERADLRDSAEDYRQDIATADAWVHQAIEVKRVKGSVAANTSSTSAPPPNSSTAATRLRVGGNLQQEKLVTQVQPIYPALAKTARITGTVRFNAIIGKDGDVLELNLVSGHPLLVMAANQAVEQWKYRPTLLNGNRVEIATVIDVHFALEP